MIRLETEPRDSAELRLEEQRRIMREEPDWFSNSEQRRIMNQSFISTETHRSRAPLKLSRHIVFSDRFRLPWFPKLVWKEGDLRYRAPSHD